MGNQQAATVRETVLLLNGTFQAPSVGKLFWWQPGSDFAQKLDRYLAQSGSSARCWAHTDTPFHWTGVNDWKDRSEAARQLAGVLLSLKHEGWRCHVVAHSHGGNVFLEALSLLGLGIEDWSDGNHVLMGTPILSTYPASDRRRVPKPRWLIVLHSTVLFAAALVLSAIYIHVCWVCLIAALSLFVLTLLFAFAWDLIYAISAGQARYMAEWKRILLVNSQRDEAFQLLTKIVSGNPFIRQPIDFKSWWLALRRSIRAGDRYLFRSTSHMSIALLVIALLSGSLAKTTRAMWLSCLFWCAAALWLPPLAFSESWRAAAFLPFRLCRNLYTALWGILSELGDLAARRISWIYIKQQAFGMTGQPAKIAAATLVPRDVADYLYEYEELPEEIAKHAEKRRSADLSANAAVITEALADPMVQLTDVQAVLSTLGASINLVHSAYYSYDECIERYAHWISKTEAERSKEREENGIIF